MAWPTDTFTATDLDVFIPEVWGNKINDFYRSKLVIADFFTDRSSELSEGGDVLYTPNMTEFSANAKTNATAVTLSSPTETKITLTVDQWFEASFSIEDRQAAQVKHSYYIQEKYAKNCGFAVAKKLGTDLALLFDNFATAVGASTTTLADSEIRAAIAALETENIDTTSEVAFFFHPNVDIMRQLAVMLVSKFREFGENLKIVFETIPSQALVLGKV